MASGKKERAPRRHKGQGSLYKQGRIWIARWMVAGRVYKRSTGESTLDAARERLASFVAPFAARSEAERYEALAARAACSKAAAESALEAERRLALCDLLARYERHPNRKPTAKSTLAHYRSAVLDLCAFVRATRPSIKEVREITPEVAAEYLSRISGRTANTYNKRLNLFASVWRVLEREIGAAENPWTLPARRSIETHSRRPLSEDELLAVFAAADASGPEAGLLFRVGAYTGLRLGDAVRLDWSEVDLNNAAIRLKPRKTASRTGAIVEIPILPPLRAALESAKERIGPVCPELAERYERSPSGVVRSVTTRVFRAAGLSGSDVGFHSLRHTFVTRCALAGVPLPVVRAIVGHSTTAMTEHYAHSNLEAARAALARAFPTK